MDVVKQGMSHGEISLDVYSQVWEECLDQVRSHWNNFITIDVMQLKMLYEFFGFWLWFIVPAYCHFFIYPQLCVL